jgi:hypothetical protein
MRVCTDPGPQHEGVQSSLRFLFPDSQTIKEICFIRLLNFIYLGVGGWEGKMRH